MGRKQGVPVALEQEMLRRANEERSTSRELSAWLKADHGITVHFTSVARVLKRLRTERTAATQGAVREKLAREATTDIDRLERLRKSVASRRRKVPECDPQAFARLAQVEASILDRKLHYAGADGEGGPDKPATVAEMLASAERVRAEEGDEATAVH